MPDVPFNTILIDPSDPRIIYAGCDFGVYVSQDRGANWYDFSAGLWDATYVMDLVAAPGNKLRAATHGKGIFESPRFTFLQTLPVTFTSFTGVNKGSYNELKWNTEQEHNLSHYELERSINTGQFQKVADITARNSFTAVSYSHNDNTVSYANTYYYRLKAVNLDGSYTYSEIVVIRTSTKGKFEVLGNPFTNSLTIRYSVPQTSKLQLSLLDMQGRFLRREELMASTGNGTYTISGLSGMPAGTYLLNFDFQNTRTTIKVLKH
ncbi:MAG: T9SS type A sorting domain-containing protein [Chitinophagaceae bacterium]|nr:T9SS type A sorting domain-containing protein [Chitinophagaceae bacterium]